MKPFRDKDHVGFCLTTLLGECVYILPPRRDDTLAEVEAAITRLPAWSTDIRAARAMRARMTELAFLEDHA